eukprot:SAG31_NODE_658_length_13104_cov_4.409919_16_plen_85_part_00
MLPAFKGGLSSRTIVGESGPIHLVKSSLETDAKLMPLYRYMCAHCDREIGVGIHSSNHNNSTTAAMTDIEAEQVLRTHFAATRR